MRWLVLTMPAVALSVACGGAQVASSLTVQVPQALVACAQPPAEQLQARLWVSGHADPCFLEVVAGGAEGDCTVTPGIERTLTLDWLIDRGGRTILLAQATKTIDLAGTTERQLAVEFTDDDYIVSNCSDLSVDPANASPTVDVNGEQRPVCDLDDDGTSNVEEVCAGDDPTGAL